MITPKKKILFSFITLLLVIVFIDIGLNFYGLFYSYQKRNLYHKENKINILCIGESTTHIGGENSYPSLLQKLLDKDFPEKYHVINFGLSGATTDYFKYRIDEILIKTNPHIVVGMLGINDSVQFERNKVHETSFLKNFLNLSFIYRYIQNYKDLNSFNHYPGKPFTFSEYLYEIKKEYNLEIDLSSFYYWLEIKDYRSFEDAYKKQFTKMHPRLSFGMAAILTAQTDSLTPLEFYAANINKSQNLELKILDFWILSLYFAAPDRNIQPLQETIKEIYRKSPHPSIFRAFIGGLLIIAKQRYNLPQGSYEIFLDFKNSNPQLFHNITALSFEKNIYTKVIEFSKKYQHNIFPANKRKLFTHKNSIQNLRYIIEKVQAADAVFIQMQYPLRSPEKIKSLFSPDHIISNEKNFKSALEQNDYYDLFIDRFAYNFGHTTPKGSKLIAQSVLEKIKEIRFSSVN